MQIYINKNNQQLGPFDEEKVREMSFNGELSPNDLAIRAGDTAWQKVGVLYPLTPTNFNPMGNIGNSGLPASVEIPTETYSFREFLGFQTLDFRWGTLMILFVVLFIGDYLAAVGFSFFRHYVVSEKFPLVTTYSIDSILVNVLSNIILAALICIFFRLINHSLIAVLAAIFAFLPMSFLINLLLPLILGYEIKYQTMLYSLFIEGFNLMSFIGGIGLVYLILKKPLHSLLIGAIVGGVFFQIVYGVIEQVTSPLPTEISKVVQVFIGFAGIRLIVSAISAGLLCLLLWLAQGKTVQKAYLSPHRYLGFLATNILLAPIIIPSLVLQISKNKNLYGVDLLLVAVVVVITLTLIILGIVTFCSLVYRMWKSIQDAQFARTTPSFAVVGLFIPFYNFYWLFQAIWGFAKDFNSHLDRNSLSLPKLNSTLFLIWCVLQLLSLIPIIGIPIALINAFILFWIVATICKSVNALQDYKVQSAG